ncbi:MAG: suppressor of fused domain protein [Saprospiraceae bacterium]|nr:suppressor of fused domain protein [Saprospiraceae bacterium]
MNFLKRLFQKKSKNKPREFSNEEFERDYELKSLGLEKVLGPMHNLVGHSVIPFDLGGSVDLYYYLNHIPGTGFATMELLDPDGNGPLPNRYGTYELVAFTKECYSSGDDVANPFNIIANSICSILTTIGLYSRQAVLNPKETMEIPTGEGKESIFIVFDLYEPEGKKFIVGHRHHHLLLCMQVFKSEMNFARKNGSAALIEMMKTTGNYPYSDLDRTPVV